MSLISYIFRRILVSIPILLGSLILVFVLSRLMPGDPTYSHLPPQHTYAQYLAMRARLGLDKPIMEQFLVYLWNLLQGDMGYSMSIAHGVKVWTLIWDRFPRTLDLSLFSMIIASVIGIKSGVISARHRNKYQDTFLRGIALVGVSIPVFWLGMILQYTLTYMIPLLPAVNFKTGYFEDPPFVTGFRLIDSIISGKIYMATDYLIHLILPVFCLSFITLASITRQTRSSMLEVLQQDYIRTARAKGAREKDVINTHALKNALIPTTTVIGLNFAGLLAGAILTETTFNLHGIGELLISAITNYDFTVLTGITLFTTIIFISVNLIVDVLYGLLDPRIRF